MSHLLRLSCLTTGLLTLLASVAVPVPAADTATLFSRSWALLEKRVAHVPRDDFNFVVLGDSRDNDQAFIQTLREAARHKPLFILHTGDYSRKGSRGETDHFLAMLREHVPDIPVFVLFGNHEQHGTFESLVGPAEFTLRLPRVSTQLVAEDNAGYALKKAQLEYLDRQLAAGSRYNFVALHIPPKTERWSWHTFSEGSSELMDILAKNRVDMAFFGHVHLFDEDTILGVRSVITGGAGAQLIPFGFPGTPAHHIVLVHVKNGTVTDEMIRVR